jgi:hypothetical protein
MGTRVRVAPLTKSVTLPDLEQFCLLNHEGEPTECWILPPEVTARCLDMSLDALDQVFQEVDQAPVKWRGAPLEVAGVQWIAGEHEALEMFRKPNTPRKRSKLFLQTGDPLKGGFRSYSFPGLQYNSVAAQGNVADCPPLSGLTDAHNRFMHSIGAKEANHFIATRYSGGKDCIDPHSDDTSTMMKSDVDGVVLITILKTGKSARPFKICEKAVSTLSADRRAKMSDDESRAHKTEIKKLQKKLDVKPLFDGSPDPLTYIIMTVAFNNSSVHSVPVVSRCGETGSLACRSIQKVVTARELLAKLLKAPAPYKAQTPRPKDPDAALWDKNEAVKRAANEARQVSTSQTAGALAASIEGASSSSEYMLVDQQSCASSSGGGSGVSAMRCGQWAVGMGS